MKSTINSSKHLHFILDNLDCAVTEREFIFNDEGKPIDYKFIYVNRTYSDNISMKQEDVIGMKATELYPKSKDYGIDQYYEVVKTGVPLTTTRYEESVERQFMVYIYKTGEKTFVLAYKDITQILLRADKYEINRATGKIFKDVSRIGYFEVNRITFNAIISDLFNEIIGQTEINEGFFRHTLLKLTHPDDYNKVANLIKDIVNGDISEVETEFKMYNEKNDYYHWVNIFVFAIEYDQNGKPFRYTGMVRDIEEEKNLIEIVEEEAQLFKQARRVADLTTFIYNVESSYFDKSDELNDFIGVENLRTIEEYRSIVHPEDLKIYDESNKYTLSGSQEKVTVYRIIKDDKVKFVQSSVFGKVDSDGNVKKVFGILKDITEIEIARRTAGNALKSFFLIFNSSPSGIFILDSEYKLSMENETFREFFGIEPGGKTLKDILGDDHDKVIEDLKKGKEIHHLRYKKRINDEEKHYVINITNLVGDFNNDFEGTLVDITQQVRDEERILYLATHDVLTDLYNRNYFEEVVTKKQEQYPLGLIICDIDGLKLINDAFGHLKGDELLQSLAKALKALSPNYIASRIGGDEFTVLVENADEEQLEKIELEIKESIKDLGLYGIDFEVSLGYAILTKENNDFSKVFNRAENMMYRRKLTDRSSRKSNALTTIMQTLHEKTEETEAHCERVGDYASMLLSEAGYKRTVDLEDIRFLSDVHDIGKIAIPDGILTKPSKLTEDEYEEIKYHSEAGYKIIKNIIDNENIAFGILYHHERYDGKGYPHGLVEQEIPLYARVLAIADSYDTMIRGRIYQKPISKEKALEDIEKNKGTQFDPLLADMFIRLIREQIK